MKAKDLMTKNIVTLTPEHTIDLAKDMMDWQNVRHLPIVDKKNKVVGILSQRDILRASFSVFSEMTKKEEKEINKKIPVKDIMSKKIVTCGPETDVNIISRKMSDNKIGSVIIVDQCGKLQGIVTETDFLTLSWDVK